MNKEILDIICCPQCHSDLKEKDNKLICTNKNCKKEYQIKDNIPILLTEKI